MCGIVGYFDKTGNTSGGIGSIVLTMLKALERRGPDSAGAAVIGAPSDLYKVRVSVAGCDDYAAAKTATQSASQSLGSTLQVGDFGETIKLELPSSLCPDVIADTLEMSYPGVEVVSIGKQLEIVKQVGLPSGLEETYEVSAFKGSHAIGHTRMSTESRIDLSHSQPFWPHGISDLAIVHNGHITNYHKLRRIYEQKGIRFYTENDSEVIGIYLREKIAAGYSLQEAVGSSIKDLDGSFCYLFASGDGFGYAKDSFGFKPLMVAENDGYVAVATEQIALTRAFGDGAAGVEPAAGTCKYWSLKGAPVA